MRSENLLTQQTEMMVRRWGQSIAQHYPEALPYWRDPVLHIDFIKSTLLGAVEKLDWPLLLCGGGTVLDLGAGTGWLSAFLSKYAVVQRVDALDSDIENLEAVLPDITRLLDGDISKIRPLLGLMEPLPFADESYDVIVASSSVHHANSLSGLLQDLRRVLKRDGVLLVLNETPRTYEEYIKYTLIIIELMLSRVAKQQTDPYYEVIGANGIGYDPKLGDYAYAYHQYANAFANAGLRYGVIDSGIYTRSLEFVHFVCTRADGRRDPASMGAAAPAPEKLRHVSPAVLERLENVKIPGDKAWLHDQLERHQRALDELKTYIATLEEEIGHLRSGFAHYCAAVALRQVRKFKSGQLSGRQSR